MSDASGPSDEQRIFDEFAAAAEDGWVSGEIRVLEAGKQAEYRLVAFHADGRKSFPNPQGFALEDAIDNIRTRLYQTGRGAWFSAVFRLEPNGRFTADFDYDSEPPWDIPVVDATYLEEQQLFPRDEQHQPDWYRQKLDRASSANR